MKKVIALLTMLFCTIAISNIKAQTVLKCPKEHDADMCLGFLGEFHATQEASESTPSVFQIVLPANYKVLAVAGPYAFFTWRISDNILTIYWNCYIGGTTEVWPEIAVGDGRNFFHIKVIY